MLKLITFLVFLVFFFLPNIRAVNERLAQKCWLKRKSDRQEIYNRRQGKEETDMLAHLHSVPVRKGRSPYDNDIGNFRQSWHKSGHRHGQKSIRQYLCR